VRREAPYWAQTLPAIPRLLHRLLAEDRAAGLQAALERLAVENRHRNQLLAGLLALAAAALALLAVSCIQ
jgi:ubiquinone biosynthesis protein